RGEFIRQANLKGKDYLVYMSSIIYIIIAGMRRALLELIRGTKLPDPSLNDLTARSSSDCRAVIPPHRRAGPRYIAMKRSRSDSKSFVGHLRGLSSIGGLNQTGRPRSTA